MVSVYKNYLNYLPIYRHRALFTIIVISNCWSSFLFRIYTQKFFTGCESSVLELSFV